MQQNCFWAITTPDNTAIGFIGYHSIDSDLRQCRISIHLNKTFWGRGITTTAVISTDRYIFDNTKIGAVRKFF